MVSAGAGSQRRGRLGGECAAQVINALKLGVGDVLNFTELPGGAIEVWPVRKGTYASLDDMGKDQRGGARRGKFEQDEGGCSQRS